jgi:hypothetical protein
MDTRKPKYLNVIKSQLETVFPSPSLYTYKYIASGTMMGSINIEAKNKKKKKENQQPGRGNAIPIF